MFSNEIPKGYIIENCPQCGNKTKLDILSFHKEEDYELPCSTTYWIILKCAACENILYAKDYWDETMTYFDGEDNAYRDYDIFKVVFPIMSYSGDNVPDPVHNSFEMAIKAQHVDGATCLLTLRRTLERVCKDQGEISGSLVTKIQNLANRGILPPVLKEASDILRKMGNEAAHGDDFNYSKNVIKEMINFTQAIIEYVYILPNRILQIKNNPTDSYIVDEIELDGNE